MMIVGLGLGDMLGCLGVVIIFVWWLLIGVGRMCYIYAHTYNK